MKKLKSFDFNKYVAICNTSINRIDREQFIKEFQKAEHINHDKIKDNLILICIN